MTATAIDTSTEVIAMTEAPPSTMQVHAARRARRGFFAATHLALQAVLLNAVSLPVMAYIIHSLGASAYGEWSTAATLVAVATVLTNLGLRGTFVRAVARDPASAEVALAHQLGIRLVLATVAALAVMALLLVLHYPAVVVACAVVASISIFINAIATTLCDLLQGLQRISIYAGVNFVAGCVLTALSVIVIAMGGGPVALTAAYLSGPLVSSILLGWFVQRSLFKVRLSWDLRSGIQSLKHSRYFAAQQFISTLSVNEESLLLPKMIDSGAFGLFSAGLLLASRLVIIPDALGSAFYPVIAEAHARNARDASREVMRFLMLALVVCLPVAVGVSFFAGPVAHVLFSANAAVCRDVILITIWSIPLLGLENVMGYALNAAGRDASQARFNLFAAMLTVPIAVVLVLKFGLIGACVSFLFRTLMKVLFVTPVFVETFAPRVPVAQLGKALACVAAMAGGLLAVRHVLPAAALVQTHPGNLRGWGVLLASWSVQTVLGMACYGIALWATRMVRPEDLPSLLGRRRRTAREGG